VKLVTALVATLAFVGFAGCADDNDGEGGAYVDGLRPAKPSLDDQKAPTPQLNPAIEHILNGGVGVIRGGMQRTPDGGEISAEEIKTPFPIDGLCHSCDVIALRDMRKPSELNITDHFGHFFCRIWVDPETTQIESTDCR
jgi:hypothetical protein